MRLNTGVSLDPEQEQQDDSEPDTPSESNQGTPKPKNGPSMQALIEFRIQQLHSRRLLLLKMQRFRKNGEDDIDGTTEEMTSEDSDKLNELEAIQKELEELLFKKEQLEKQGKSPKLNQQNVHPTFCQTKIPCGGIYLLPPLQLTQEDMTLEQIVQSRLTGPVVPVDGLGGKPAVTQCPSCQEVVFTQTCSRGGEAMWILCCLCSMMGCVAGCCLIPFFIDRLRTIQHKCPHCQAHIHTHQPF